MSDQPKIPCAANPFSTCPYRRDTPPGIWDKSEYDKLPAWDGTEMHEANTSIFLCHSANLGGKESVCRGWMEVHSGNFGVRLNIMARIDHNSTPTTVPLYDSGRQARRMGLRGAAKPSTKACKSIAKLVSARERITGAK